MYSGKCILLQLAIAYVRASLAADSHLPNMFGAYLGLYSHEWCLVVKWTMGM
jgi:hypothetical protein